MSARDQHFIMLSIIGIIAYTIAFSLELTFIFKHLECDNEDVFVFAIIVFVVLNIIAIISFILHISNMLNWCMWWKQKYICYRRKNKNG